MTSKGDPAVSNRYGRAVTPVSSLHRLARQFVAFFGVGIAAAIVHYGLLIGLVEGAGSAPVPATLAGYVAGGLVSYALNRRHTYESNRPHREATWRFAAVAFVGFLLTWLFMQVFTVWLGAPYLAAQLVTTGIVMLWSFLAHKAWTFA
ncbi:GtrA family protein [Microvirga puerhi]|uniref:GtrA family protein n=1 Tax=Microvirga puerhi TaxID=2876078 RepID=A0ABS7VT73_9HYPH|nr:GtrA family protein [Microvirga puerhi]MBZ6078132.1 GtrA family protein [Microvirga puerhi]